MIRTDTLTLEDIARRQRRYYYYPPRLHSTEEGHGGR